MHRAVINELSGWIRHMADAYYQTQAVVSDDLYDRVKEIHAELTELEKKDR